MARRFRLVALIALKWPAGRCSLPGMILDERWCTFRGTGAELALGATSPTAAARGTAGH